MSGNPIADMLVRDYRLMLVTLVWQDGTRRTIATSNPADLVSIGIKAKGNEPPAAFDAMFAGKMVEEPRSQADVLRIAIQRSVN